MKNMIKRTFFIAILCSGAILQISGSKKDTPQPSYTEMFSNVVKEALSSPEGKYGRLAMTLVSLALSGAGSTYAVYQLYKRIKEASETLTEFEKNGSKNLNFRLFPRYFIKTLLTLGGLGVSSVILYHTWQQLMDPTIYKNFPTYYY